LFAANMVDQLFQVIVYQDQCNFNEK